MTNNKTYTKTIYEILIYNRGQARDIELIKSVRVLKGNDQRGWNEVYAGKNPLFKTISRGAKGKLVTRTSTYAWDMNIEQLKFK